MCMSASAVAHAFGPTHSIFSRVAHLVAEVGVHGGLHEREVEDAVHLAVGLAREDVVDLRALRVQAAAVGW